MLYIIFWSFIPQQNSITKLARILSQNWPVHLKIYESFKNRNDNNKIENPRKPYRIKCNKKC